MTLRIVIVTDPMCSWCWGMADAIDEVRTELAARADFDIQLGGINTHGTRPIGDYGRRRLDRLWDEVSAVTGVAFSHRLADGCVYNSVLPCLATEAIRDVTGEPPFTFVRRLQRAFFVESVNVNDMDTLCAIAAEFGVAGDELRERMNTTEIRTRTRWGFERSRQYGTQALPSVLYGVDELALLAGGYIDAATLAREILVRLDALDRSG